MFHAIYVGPVSACFELDNDAPFYAPKPYAVLLDGTKAFEGAENVFSLFGLEPDRGYAVTVQMDGAAQTLTVHTACEKCAVSVRAFGAVGDGATDDTAAIQRGILSLPEGGRLVIPEGVYLTGPVFLKSHMTLELQRGATLLGRTEKAAYPVLPATAEDLDGGKAVHFGGFEGLARDMYAAPITAEYARDIRIIGPGRLDGNAQRGDWWQTFMDDPVARPRLMFLNRCEDVTVHGLDCMNAASWQLHPYYCKNIAFFGVSVSAPKDSPNTDALDPECCDGVDIVGCRFSVGDDCIAIKSGKLELHKMCPAPASRHTIRNCLMAFGHGAVTLGSEISGGIKALNVSQCLFKRTDRGLRIKTRRGRGRDCDIDGIAFDNIRMEGVLTPIVMNMWYRCVDPDGDSDYVQGRAPLPLDDRTPRLGRFRFSNMDCVDAEVAACYCDGLPEQPIAEVAFENVRVRFAQDARPGVPSMFTHAPERCRMGCYFNNVDRVTLNNVQIDGHTGEAVVAEGVREIIVENCEGLNHV